MWRVYHFNVIKANLCSLASMLAASSQVFSSATQNQ